jgi:alkanesulfonate monooxygenase SsuD/methylene tetrahydromethanopterin reductase-like flavin-dependent oxidoreductase (luciferase family)
MSRGKNERVEWQVEGVENELDLGCCGMMDGYVLLVLEDVRSVGPNVIEVTWVLRNCWQEEVSFLHRPFPCHQQPLRLHDHLDCPPVLRLGSDDAAAAAAAAAVVGFVAVSSSQNVCH